MIDNKLLRDIDIALHDWMHAHAPEMCEDSAVKEAAKRVWDGGGTLHYIAALRKRIAEQLAVPEALPPELTAEMRANVVEANRSRAAKGFEPFLKIGSEGWALEQIYAELRRSMNKERQ